MKKYRLANGDEIYKLPYIKDKRLYAAVMTACSMVKESGWLNKACKYAADKYDVRESDVRDYVLIASRRGRIISGNSGRKRAKQHKVTRVDEYYSAFISCHTCGDVVRGCDMDSVIESWNYKQQEAKRRTPNAMED